MTPPVPRDLAQRETDALASMLGADSRRIDDLVDSVGEIKGDVRTLKADASRTANGVEQLQQSMAILNRHAVVMETQSAELSTMRSKYDGLDTRVRNIELEMPALKDSRADLKKGVWIVIGLVIAAGMALIIKP
jgi:chromosome segregation ATPase